MRPRAHIIPRAKGVFILAISLAVSACHSRSPAYPAVVFSSLPPADVGGPDKLGTIAGRATGAGPDQQIVLYARSEDLWWVQPYTDHPFTKIQHDSTWRGQTHLGTEYAALLVDKEYTPPETTEVLPAVGSDVAAVAIAKGVGPAPPTPTTKTLHFSGYDWTVRTGGSYRGGSHNSFNPANAWTDNRGALHLRIARASQNWSSGEVRLTRSLGYGTYRFVVSDTSHLEPSAVFSVADWDGVGTEQNRREFDIELSHWGYAKNDNAQYVVQPYYIPINIVRFSVPAGVLTHALHWEPRQVAFSTFAGSNAATVDPIHQHVFTSGVPAPGQDSIRISLYVYGKGQIPLKKEAEVVIEKFEYLP